MSTVPAALLSLTSGDFMSVLGELPDSVKTMIASADLRYEPLADGEHREEIGRMAAEVAAGRFETVGAHRLTDWERGWEQNLRALESGDTDALLPHYSRRIRLARWRQRLIRPLSPRFEPEVLAILLQFLFETYMRDARAIYEFGCGTGQHLVQLQALYPEAVLTGLDWTAASGAIIAGMGERGQLRGARSHRFDFFNPDYGFHLERGSAIYTVAALEQIGDGHAAFLDYLLREQPSLCVHVEPIGELLDSSHELDRLSLDYFTKRKWLAGFLTALRELEGHGRVRIHRAQRTYVSGNPYVDHYSIAVWSPLPAGQ